MLNTRQASSLLPPAEAQQYFYILQQSFFPKPSSHQINQSYAQITLFGFLTVLFGTLLGHKVFLSSRGHPLWFFRKLRREQGTYYIPNGTTAFILFMIPFYALACAQGVFEWKMYGLQTPQIVGPILYQLAWLAVIIAGWISICAHAISVCFALESLAQSKSGYKFVKPAVLHVIVYGFLLLWLSTALGLGLWQIVAQSHLYAAYSKAAALLQSAINGVFSDSELPELLQLQDVIATNSDQVITRGKAWATLQCAFATFVIVVYIPFCVVFIRLLKKSQQQLKGSGQVTMRSATNTKQDASRIQSLVLPPTDSTASKQQVTKSKISHQIQSNGSGTRSPIAVVQASFNQTTSADWAIYKAVLTTSYIACVTSLSISITIITAYGLGPGYAFTYQGDMAINWVHIVFGIGIGTVMMLQSIADGKNTDSSVKVTSVPVNPPLSIYVEREAEKLVEGEEAVPHYIDSNLV